ncbi:hypothetical protein BaRGS_00020173 [Batillaria attramentaria]|uniref:Myb/SANT-like DNA-binding domain-containing protein n=1 Tax=Batillaria attramentaria TaxID=370345 RepID=A0ABD0KNQ0_9CAEN
MQMEHVKLFSSRSPSITKPIKNEIWRHVTDRVNACGEAHRMVQNIQDKWRGLPGAVLNKKWDERKTGRACTCTRNVMKEMNIGMSTPKKDKCNLCIGHDYGNIDETEYAAHILRKTEAQTEKEKDKAEANTDTVVLTMVLMAPKLLANASYFKTKLTCHNLTLQRMK